jgi:hypothetical protein
MLSSFLLLPLTMLMFQIHDIRGWLGVTPPRNFEPITPTRSAPTVQRHLRDRCRVFAAITVPVAALIIGTNGDRTRGPVMPLSRPRRWANRAVQRVLIASPRISPQTT